ncbi:MAG: N-dimethylarginine dimethylaminohydrolase [Parasphingorhabdus sp.]
MRRGNIFNRELAFKQHEEMAQVYTDAGVNVHCLPADENLPYQAFARDSNFMTPYGVVVTQIAQSLRRDPM